MAKTPHLTGNDHAALIALLSMSASICSAQESPEPVLEVVAESARADTELGAGCAPGHGYCLEQTITKIDIRQEHNETAHHTKDFSDATKLILRRGSLVDLWVHVEGDDYDEECHELAMEAHHEFNGILTAIEIPPVNAPQDEWGVDTLAVDTSFRSYVATLQISVPSDAPVGEYEFAVKVLCKETCAFHKCVLAYANFPKSVVILFNPWDIDDDVYLASDTERDEYVLAPYGRMWKPNLLVPDLIFDWGDGIEWSFAQFENPILEVTLGLLDGLSDRQRASPAQVSRQLSALVDRHGDGGMIFGKWCKEDDATCNKYLGGLKPWYWSGSDQIMTQFQATGQPVKYGQCWVYAGVLTSSLRALGIPARPITNVPSGHDENGDGQIHRYWDDNGQLIDTPDNEEWWIFHSWVDAWMDRTDAASGWQAVDATPQETSKGIFQLGPAAHADIREHTLNPYDVLFVVSEVDARYIRHLGAAIQVDDTWLGQAILTKSPGPDSQVPEIITSSYKNQRSNDGRSSSDVQMTFTVKDASAQVDQPLEWSLAATNTGASTHTVDMIITAVAQEYNGAKLAELGNVGALHVLRPGETQIIELSISVDQYRIWLAVNPSFLATGFVRIVEANSLLADQSFAAFSFGTLDLTLQPSGPAEPKDQVQCNVVLKNPLDVPLTNGQLVIAVGEGMLVEGQREHVVEIGAVGVGQQSLTSVHLVPSAAGDHLIRAVFLADELTEIRGSANLLVVVPACLADITAPSGVVDVNDLLLVINNWGGGVGNIADINDDGEVNVEDLLEVINGWGDCP